MPQVVSNPGTTYLLEVAFDEVTAFELGTSALDTGLLGDFDPIPTWTDVTASMTSVSVERGRSDIERQPDAGSLALTLLDSARDYDPSNTAGPYFGRLLPRKQARLTVAGVAVATGRTGPWKQSLRVGTTQTAAVVARDALAQLAEATITSDTVLLAATSGLALDALLDAPGVDWTATTAIEAGVGNISATSVAAGANALDTAQRLAAGEGSVIFADPANVLTMRARDATVGASVAAILTPDGTGVQYAELESVYAGETYSTVVVEDASGTAFALDEPDLLAAYGPLALRISPTFLADATEAAALADWLAVVAFAEEVAVRQLLFRLTGAMSPADQSALLGLDIGDVVQVTRAWQTGTPLTTTDWYQVGAISHRITREVHDQTLTLEPASLLIAFKLDSALGTLSGGIYPGSPLL